MPARGYRKFTQARQDEYLRSIADDGLCRAAAAKAAGVSITTVLEFIRANPEFAARRDEAEMQRNGQVEDALFQAAVSGNVTACLAFLYSRDPENWSDRRRMEMTGKAGGPIKHEVNFSEYTEEELIREAEAILHDAANQ